MNDIDVVSVLMKRDTAEHFTEVDGYPYRHGKHGEDLAKSTRLALGIPCETRYHIDTGLATMWMGENTRHCQLPPHGPEVPHQ